MSSKISELQFKRQGLKIQQSIGSALRSENNCVLLLLAAKQHVLLKTIIILLFHLPRIPVYSNRKAQDVNIVKDNASLFCNLKLVKRINLLLFEVCFLVGAAVCT